jgi:hypothetical protein
MRILLECSLVTDATLNINKTLRPGPQVQRGVSSARPKVMAAAGADKPRQRTEPLGSFDDLKLL